MAKKKKGKKNKDSKRKKLVILCGDTECSFNRHDHHGAICTRKLITLDSYGRCSLTTHNSCSRCDGRKL